MKKQDKTFKNYQVAAVRKTADLSDAAELIPDNSFLFDKESSNLYIKNCKALVKVTETVNTQKLLNDIGIINSKLAFGYEQDKKLNEYIRQNAELINELTRDLQANKALDDIQAGKLDRAKESWAKVASGLVEAVDKNTKASAANADSISMNYVKDESNASDLERARKLNVVRNVVFFIAIVAIGLKAFLF